MKPFRRIPMLLAAGTAAAVTLLAPMPAQAAGTYSLLILPDQGESQIQPGGDPGGCSNTSVAYVNGVRVD